MSRVIAPSVLGTALALFLAPVPGFAQTALFGDTVRAAKTSGPGGDGGAGKAVTVTPDLFTGTFSYRIPVEVPLGRHGMQPEIFVRYRSVSGNGGAGIGWDVDLGAVERSSRFGIRFDGDEYVLKDLAGLSDLVRTATGPAETEYRAIIESDFTRVKKIGDRFEATTRNGVRYSYGQSAASREYDQRPNRGDQVFRWRLDRIEDPNGNFLTVAYRRDPTSVDPASRAALYIDQIDYGGGPRQAPNASVKFHWEIRSDTPLSYGNGFPVRMRYRLRSIEVRAGGALIRAYRLEYLSNGPFTDRARLGSIQEFGSDATVAADGLVAGPSSLPATSFSYHAGGTPTDAKVAGPVRQVGGSFCYLSELEHDIGRAVTGDFDGDGRADLAWIRGWNGRFPMEVFYGGASGLATKGYGPYIAVAGDHEGLITGEHRIKAGDFNGDGRTDIAVLEGWGAGWPGVPMSIYYATPADQGRGFLAAVPGPSRYTAGDHEGARIDAGRVLVGDFNGDGRADFLTIEGWNSAAYGGYEFPWKLYLSNPAATNGFDAPVDTSIKLHMPGDHAGLWDVLARTKLGDFNGDGKTDVAYLDGWQTWNIGGLPMKIWYANETGTDFVAGSGPVRSVGGDHDAVRIDAGRIIPGDFNGDGKVDLIAADGWNSGSTPTPMTLYLSNGNGFDAPAAVGPSLYYPGDYAGMYDVIARFKTGDFNGDSKTDIAVVEGWSGVVDMSIYLSTGNGFKERIPGPRRLMGGDHEMVRLDAARVLVGDVDGDGKSDFAAIEGCQGAQAGFPLMPVPAGSYPMSVYLAPSSPPDLLASIANNQGGTTHLEYLPSSWYANRQLPLVIQTLTAMTTRITGFDGATTAATTSFAYSGGYFHLRERDFRGFAYAAVVDPPGQNGERLLRETWFHQGNGVEAIADDPSVPTGYTKGKPWRSRLSDHGAPSTFKQSVTTYWPDAAGAGTWAAADGAAPWFTPLRSEENTTWEAGVVTVQSRTDVADYDDHGNVEREVRHGDLATTSDDATVVRTFSPNSAAWIVSLPATEEAYSGASPAGVALGAKLTGKSFYYDGAPLLLATASEQQRRDLCADGSTGAQSPTRGNVTREVAWSRYCDKAGTCTEGPHPEIRNGHDEFGNVVCARDERGYVTTTEYDATATYPRFVTNAVRQRAETTHYGVDGAALDFGLYGQTKSVTDANLTTAEFRYDKLGRKARAVAPGATQASGANLDWTVTTWSYGGYATDGRQYVRTEVHSKAGPLGAVGSLDASSRIAWTESYLDGAAREVRGRKPGPDGKVVVTSRVLDARGAIAFQSDPFFEIGDVQRGTTVQHDAFGRIVATTTGRGTAAVCRSGGVTVKIDDNRHRRRETRDANGRLVKVEEYRGTYPLPCDTFVRTPYAVTQYAYDRLGALTLVTDAKGNKTEIRYDSIGRKRYLHDPDMGEIEYRYDLAGNLVWQQDPVARDFVALPGFERAITFEYDGLNRMTRKAYPDGADVTWEYDVDHEAQPQDPALPPSAPKGRLTRTTDASGSETYRYDAAGRLTRSTKTIQSVGTYAIKTAYDALGRAARLVYPTGDVVDYGYDAAGNLVSAGSYVVYSTFNALGQARFAQYGNLVKTEMTYHDATSRLLDTLTIDSPPDANGAGTGIRRYVSLTHRYDGVGNVTWIGDGVDPTRSQTLHYDELDRIDSVQSQRWGSSSYAYDEIGNITLKDGVTYSYPTEPHSLVGTVGDRPHATTGSSDTSPGRLRQITYDLDNRPIFITRGGATTSFAYDGAGDRVRKSTFQGVTGYVKGLVECTAAACGIYLVAGPHRIALKTGADVKYYHQNHVGSTVVVTSATGTALEQLTYRPYGETSSDTGAVSMKHKFTGQEKDPETDLYYYGARYYDAALGRFISPDSVVPDAFDPQLLNRYAYARNSPLKYVDPTGHEPITVGVFVAYLAIDTAVIYYTVSAAVITSATLFAVGDGNIKEGWVRTREGAGGAWNKAGQAWDWTSDNTGRAWNWSGEKAGEASSWTRERIGAGRSPDSGSLLQAPAPMRPAQNPLKDFDYVTIGVGWFDGIGGSFHVTVDRNGYVTFGPAAGIGAGGKGFGVALGRYQNRDDQRASRETLRSLNTGVAINASAAAGVGYGLNLPWRAGWWSLEPQLALPGGGVTVGYSWEWRRFDWLSW